ncbi:MAG: cation:proton antiporter [Elainellaceae cyanobacterium]
MDTPFGLTLQIVIATIAGISAQVLGDYFKLPSIVFLLLFGILVGPDGLNLLHPSDLGSGLEVIVALSVALVLFEGGLSLELRDLGRVSSSLQNLVTVGTLVTLIGGGMAAHWLSEFPWPLAFLYASLVVVTGPTVIGPLLKQVSVDRQVATLLEGEGVLVDPVGAILAVVVLDVILNGDTDPLAVISGLLLRLSIGGAIGAIGGWILGFFLKRAEFLSEELKNLVVLAGVWGLFGLAQIIQSESGLMATVLAGIVLRAASVPEERLLRRFKGQLTILAVSVLFILLSADLSIASVFALGSGALLTVAVLMFVVRPINVWLCTWNSDLNWRQKFFLAWVAPKGIVSASVASLFAILLTERGISGGDAIKALVFLTIIATVSVQGLTAGWVARWLQITSTQATGAVIVGCNPLSRIIARFFQENNESIVIIDTDEEACAEAEQEGLPVVASSALDMDVLEAAGLASSGTFLAITNNGEVNLVLAQRASEEFKPPRVLVVSPGELKTTAEQPPSAAPAATGTAKAAKPPKGSSPKVQQAFTEQLPLKKWNGFIKDGAVKLGETTLRETGLLFQQAHLRALTRAGELVPLLIERNLRFQVVQASEEWRPGDRIIYLLHDPRPKLLRRLSGGTTPGRLSLEKLPAVEEIPMPVPMPSGEPASKSSSKPSPPASDNNAKSDSPKSDSNRNRTGGSKQSNSNQSDSDSKNSSSPETSEIPSANSDHAANSKPSDSPSAPSQTEQDADKQVP